MNARPAAAWIARASARSERYGLIRLTTATRPASANRRAGPAAPPALPAPAAPPKPRAGVSAWRRGSPPGRDEGRPPAPPAPPPDTGEVHAPRPPPAGD